jgi:hypothetical protein
LRTSIKIAAIAATVTITAAGVAYASVPDATGQIHACYTKSATRIVDNPKCKSGEKALAWNIKGNPGPAGPAGAGVAPETRVGHCLASVHEGSPAGVYTITCTYKRPFTDPCAFPSVVATPANLGTLETEDDGLRGQPGTDYFYWVMGLEGVTDDNECTANLTSFHLVIKTLRAAPANRRINMGFTYSAAVPTKR